MAYKALYRTYRPSTFDEVAGQQQIVRTIKNALATGKLSHAYLFAGPRGTGKTSMAKLLAKALNCEEGIGHQCNHCENCLAINEGTHPDVIEIDAASNNGVEQVRDIIDKVKYGTILGRYKVYIIDEVHMMSSGAFNALLKTLEEPPEHVIFILATTEPYKILPTILSRCQRYDFTKVSNKDIKDRIRTILEKESILFNDAAVDLIISLADGGVRDALSMLDQVLAYSGDELKEEDVLEIFSLESEEEKIALVNSIVNGNASDVLKRLNKYIDKGSDIKRLTSDLLDIFKDLLIYMNTRNGELLEKLTLSQAADLSKKVKNKQVLEMVDILMDTIKDYKNVSSINPLFEVALLKMVSIFGTNKEEPAPLEDKAIVIKPEVKDDEEVYDNSPLPEVKEPKVEKKVEPIIREQPSLFDFNPNEIVLPKNLIIPKEVTGDEQFQIDDDLMVRIMVTAKKEVKNDLTSKWSLLNKLTAHPKLGTAAALLLDSHLLVASKSIIIIECQTPKMVLAINDKTMQENLQTVLKTVFGEQMFTYAVSRSTSIELQDKYKNLYQVGRLPKAKDVVIEFVGGEE